ncbi:MAG: magnetochrome domain-containing protein [Alphaproteobacteria bacterium]|nr:magnetochrome domain-containing protein [Alphaproteobacteria bacterium]
MLLLLAIVGVALGWESFKENSRTFSAGLTQRRVEGVLMGRFAQPTEQGVLGTLGKLFETEEPEYQLMTVRHIPRIQKGQPMPHPYVGSCLNCHLYIDGPGPGTQPKTPMGAVLEKMSKVHKLGPPLLPTSTQPHPEAGRCIKCHDIVVKVPVEKKKGGFLWRL